MDTQKHPKGTPMATEIDKPRTCTKRPKVLVDVEVEAHFHTYYRKVEDRAAELDRRVDEFNTFIRDHRSQDDVRLIVNRKYQDQCSGCGNEWETFIDEDTGGKTCCAHCGREVQS